MEPNNLKPNHRILVVDDNPSIHSDFRKILCPDNFDSGVLDEMESVLFEKVAPRTDKLNFELDSAYQGQDALAMVQQSLAENRPYAMAFVDVRMPPGWDGVETIARIWEIYPQLQIVVCTAYSDYSWDDMRSKVGQPDSLVILKKPFDNVEVQQLAQALTKKWLLNLQANLKLAELETMVNQRTAELAQANKSLSVSEERFSKAFHASPVPSAIQNVADHRLVDVNQRLATITGWKREEMIGRTPAELFLWQKPELIDSWIAALTEGETIQDQEANLRTESGALHEVLVSLSPVLLDEKPHLLLLAQDVAERALLERQLRQAQKMEAIGQLAAGVAHDFNNILTVIQGHAGLMKQKLEADNPLTKSLDQTIKASNRAATLIRQLLMFSRKQVMQTRSLDLNETIGNATKMLDRLVGEHVQIQFQSQQPLPAINADPTMIEQIVMNLAVNARDAMPEGGKIFITTSLETVHREPNLFDTELRDGNFVCLVFRDTGTGMDTQILSRIFEPFFTTKPIGKGTGLGLSTVFGIVKQHHGWIEVESKPDGGTTFRVYFPTSLHAAEKNEPAVEIAPQFGRETILVAEDEEDLREMVVEVLRIQGYHVLEACSGQHALEVWEQAGRPVDLLLTDMVMPGGVMGSELAERLLIQSPRLKVIYTSGYSPGMAGKDASLLEGRNFLAKPYSVNKLAQSIRECLDAAPENN